ncbi:hypothetical protein LINPERHAP1_LOCUS29138, partial [Linum perenne]
GGRWHGPYACGRLSLGPSSNLSRPFEFFFEPSSQGTLGMFLGAGVGLDLVAFGMGPSLGVRPLSGLGAGLGPRLGLGPELGALSIQGSGGGAGVGLGPV